MGAVWEKLVPKRVGRSGCIYIKEIFHMLVPPYISNFLSKSKIYGYDVALLGSLFLDCWSFVCHPPLLILFNFIKLYYSFIQVLLSAISLFFPTIFYYFNSHHLVFLPHFNYQNFMVIWLDHPDKRMSPLHRAKGTGPFQDPKEFLYGVSTRKHVFFLIFFYLIFSCCSTLEF